MFHNVLLSLFPNEVEQFFLRSIYAKAIEQNLFQFDVIDLRQFGIGKHQKVDDYPVSEKKGMLLRADVILNALKSLADFQQYRIIYTCPKGRVFDQKFAHELKNEKKGLIIIPGYFRGIDQRIFDCVNIERVSVGNYVLNSGDLPALSILDSVTRLIPGVLGNSQSIETDSIESTWLESAQYTKPDSVENVVIPAYLKSGNHEDIRTKRLHESINNTMFCRSDLIKGKIFDKIEQKIISESIKSVL